MTESPGILMTIVILIHRIVVFVGRYVLQNFIYGKKGKKVPPIKNPLLFEPATVLAAKIRTRKVTSFEVMKAFIDRAKEVNPIINCVVDERYSEALKEAEEVDKFIASGIMTPENMEKSKPFLGVPLSTKDAVPVKGMVNTSGWFYRKGYIAKEDCEPIAKMKKAGAIPFCLTNVPEMCMWYESNNKIYGKTGNPYDNFRICGGSSGGEGALLGSGGSPFGIGSDIGGSIRMPAFFNGIFGHKTSRLIVSNEKHFPCPHTKEEDHMMSVGPMTRFACDLKPMLKIMAMDDKVSLLRLDEPVNIKKLKIYYQENDLSSGLVLPVEKDVQIALLKAIDYLKNTMNLEVNKVQISRTKDTVPMWLANLCGSGGIPLSEQFSPIPGQRINHFLELFKSIFGKSNHMFISLLTSFNQDYGMKSGSPKHKHLLEECEKIIQEFSEMLDENSVFLYPTHPTVAPYHYETIIRFPNYTYTALFNVLGMPSCNVPLGLGNEGLPVGIQVAANYNNDRLCLAVAETLEKAFGGWVHNFEN